MSGVARVPSLPNFVRMDYRAASLMMPIENLTDGELRELGQRWTEALVAHAAKRREEARNG